MAAAISLNDLLPNSPTFEYHECRLTAPCSLVHLCEKIIHLSSRHVQSSSQTSQACGLAIGIPLRVYTVPFCSNVYSINVHLLAFIVICYPHAFASDPIVSAIATLCFSHRDALFQPSRRFVSGAVIVLFLAQDSSGLAKMLYFCTQKPMSPSFQCGFPKYVER